MRFAAAGCCLLLATLVGCHLAPSGSSMDRAEAESTSAAFMSDLISDRVDLAIAKMEPEFAQEAGRANAEKLFQQMFDYCGRPLEAEMRHDEIGFVNYADGRQKPMRAFFYSGKTTQHEKGACFFAVRIVPSGKGMSVVNFGPLKLMSGELPDWAK